MALGFLLVTNVLLYITEAYAFPPMISITAQLFFEKNNEFVLLRPI
jgi:predicted glycosyltransferase